MMNVRVYDGGKGAGAGVATTVIVLVMRVVMMPFV